MPFQNRLQYDKQWDLRIPIILCTFLGLVTQIDLLIHVMIFWNLPVKTFYVECGTGIVLKVVQGY